MQLSVQIGAHASLWMRISQQSPCYLAGNSQAKLKQQKSHSQSQPMQNAAAAANQRPERQNLNTTLVMSITNCHYKNVNNLLFVK